MFLMNSEMYKRYSKKTMSNVVLSGSLRALIDKGFVREDNCLFLKECFEIQTNASRDNFIDDTGCECFFNSVNIDDYEEDMLLEKGLMFAQEVFNKFSEQSSSEILNCVMSMDEFGLKVKFHLVRTGEQWLSDDLEKYEEAILVADSSEILLKLPVA